MEPLLLGFLTELFQMEACLPRPRWPSALVFADWLEDESDPRAEDVRCVVQLRPQLDACPFTNASTGEKSFWRWPAKGELPDLWWDLLVEPGKEEQLYIRWQADPTTSQGRAIYKQTLRYTLGYLCQADEVSSTLDLCCRDLIAGLLGWTRERFEKSRNKK